MNDDGKVKRDAHVATQIQRCYSRPILARLQKASNNTEKLFAALTNVQRPCDFQKETSMRMKMFYNMKNKAEIYTMANSLVNRNIVSRDDCNKLSEQLISRKYNTDNVLFTNTSENYGQEVEFKFREDGKQQY